MPSGIDEHGRPEYLPPGLRLIAVHKETGERRTFDIPGKEFCDSARFPGAWKRALEAFGIYHLLNQGPVSKRLTSARQLKGWPVYTQFIIPALYELLLPYYDKPGHSSTELKPVRARFPKELLAIMLDILRFEDPQAFTGSTVGQLAGVIQRYLAKKAEANY